MEALERYAWPGNVRELENLVERSLILSAGPVLAIDAPGMGAAGEGPGEPPAEALEEVERDHLSRALEACGWRIRGPGNAAERLGLKESTLRYRMKKLGIRRPAIRRPDRG